MTLAIGNTLDWVSPINWLHSLNQGLLGAWAVVPGTMYGPRLNDLTGRYPGAFNHTNSRTAWTDAADRSGGSGAMQFDQSTGIDWLLVNNGPIIPDVTNLSITAWVRLDSLPGTSVIYREASDAGSFHSRISFYVNSGTSVLRYSPFTGTTNLEGSAISNGVWTWVGVSQKPGTNNFKLYINGKVDATTTIGTNTGGVPTHASIGGDASESIHLLDGRIDDVNVWDRALGDDEMRFVYEESLLGNPNRWNWLIQEPQWGFSSPAVSATRIIHKRRRMDERRMSTYKVF